MNQFDPPQMDASEQPQTGDPSGSPPEGADDGMNEYAISSAKPANNALYVLLALVVLGAGLVLFMHMRTGPNTAAASPEAATAKATINQFLTDGDKNIMAMRELLKNTEKVVQQFLDYPMVNQVKLEDLKTNPFQFAVAKAPEGPTPGDIEKTKAREKEAVVKIIQGLKIQTIMVGGKTRTAMINNAMYTEGQQIESLTIEKITPNSVVVTKDSALAPNGQYRYELKIQK